MITRSLKPTLHALSPLLARHDVRLYSGVGLGAAALAVGTVVVVRRIRRPSAEELERRRCEHVATVGRITDGFVLDALTLAGEPSLAPAPEVLVYSYTLAGVTYHCAQDVSHLPDKVSGYRLDQPVSVRYDPRNPGNSIIVSESWSGLY